MRFIYVASPATFSHPQQSLPIMSPHRVRRFSEDTVALMRDLHIPIVDGGLLTDARWESSTDGTAFVTAADTSAPAASAAARMIAQVSLNVVYAGCSAVGGGAALGDDAAAVPLSIATTDCAAVADSPFGDGSHASAEDVAGTVTTANGVTFAVSLPAFGICAASSLVLTPADPTVLQGVDNADAMGVTVRLHMWTDAGDAGQPCGAFTPKCRRMSRQLHLRLSDKRDSVVAVVTPDPSVQQYQFVVQVRRAVGAVVWLRG
jgi:hypothetical protein